MAIHTCEGMHHRFVVGPGEPVVCPHCELVTLRAQVADKDCAVAMLAAQTRAKLELLGKVMELEAQLAECQAVIRHKGHDADCPARRCSFVGFTGRCGQSPAWHKEVKVGHAYQSPPCSCGYSRCVEGGE